MIRIQRPPAPDFLVDTDGKWAKETKAAIAHYTSGETKAFDFKTYNDTLLKDELKKTFLKCAYCESSYGAVYDGDVEHFRPKGKVAEKDPPTPGYYWLANDWDNLFLACQHCNQRRKHLLFGETELRGYGKLDQFPIATETQRLRKPDDPRVDSPHQEIANFRSGSKSAVTPVMARPSPNLCQLRSTPKNSPNSLAGNRGLQPFSFSGKPAATSAT